MTAVSDPPQNSTGKRGWVMSLLQEMGVLGPFIRGCCQVLFQNDIIGGMGANHDCVLLLANGNVSADTSAWYHAPRKMCRMPHREMSHTLYVVLNLSEYMNTNHDQGFFLLCFVIQELQLNG